MKRVILLFICLTMSVFVARAATPGYAIEQLFLYQPPEVVDDRIPDSNCLTDYIKRLQDVCRRFFASARSPETLDIVVAVRPGKQSKVWFISSRQSSDDARKTLRKNLEGVTPCQVTKGPIAFALAGKVAGGDGKRRAGTPMPVEWQKAADRKGNAEIPDGILDSVWPRR